MVIDETSTIASQPSPFNFLKQTNTSYLTRFKTKILSDISLFLNEMINNFSLYLFISKFRITLFRRLD